MTFLYALVLFGVACYVGLAAAAVRVLRRPWPDWSLPVEPPFVSVLVAARNEAADLPACLDALRAQDYPAGCFECIVADDGSTDATAALAAAVAAEDPRFRVVPVAPVPGGALRGKARALHTAFGAARGSILLVTDADCRPPAGWVRGLVGAFDSEAVGMVCGVTRVAGDGLAARVQALDWRLLLALAAAAARLDRPLTAMGNNMAFRRAAYVDVGGYPALSFSVTEDYALFRAVGRTGRWRVRLVLDARLQNTTLPLPTLTAAFRQRRRWARGGLRADPWVFLLYAVVFGAHIGLLAGFFTFPLLAGLLLGLKVGADAYVLRAAARLLGTRAGLGVLPAFEAYLFTYVLLLPASLLFFPRIRWKGRRL